MTSTSTTPLNTRSPTIKRILREAAELSSLPSPDYHAAPLPSNIFEWHFTLRGPPSTPYERGIYHGRIILPAQYPLRPPSFRFVTPSGRFETNREICLSISGHHEETWQPAWGVRTAIVALRAFMEGDARGQVGGLEMARAERERLAGESARFVCAVCGRCNEDILREAGEGVEEGEGERKKEEVPKELVIGTKEELEARRKEAEGGQGKEEREGDGDGDAYLAEGFVKTQGEAESGMAREYPEARPAQGVPKPTAAVAQTPVQSPVQRGNTVQAPLRTQQVTGDGVPAWIDRAIAGLVVCLVVMIFRIIIARA